MESPNQNSAFKEEVLKRVILEVIGLAAFLIFWTLYWQMRDPSSKLRIKLLEFEDTLDGWQKNIQRKQMEREYERQVRREILALEAGFTGDEEPATPDTEEVEE